MNQQDRYNYGELFEQVKNGLKTSPTTVEHQLNNDPDAFSRLSLEFFDDYHYNGLGILLSDPILREKLWSVWMAGTLERAESESRYDQERNKQRIPMIPQAGQVQRMDEALNKLVFNRENPYTTMKRLLSLAVMDDPSLSMSDDDLINMTYPVRVALGASLYNKPERKKSDTIVDKRNGDFDKVRFSSVYLEIIYVAEYIAVGRYHRNYKKVVETPRYQHTDIMNLFWTSVVREVLGDLQDGDCEDRYKRDTLIRFVKLMEDYPESIRPIGLALRSSSTFGLMKVPISEAMHRLLVKHLPMYQDTWNHWMNTSLVAQLNV